MEILEKQDPEKRRLMDEAKKHKDNLKSEVRLVSEQTEKVITNALIIGGALTLTYLLISGLSGSKSKKKKAKTVNLVAQPQSESGSEASGESDSGDSILSQIGNKIASEATVFLLNIAKEKLNEYLQSRKSESEANR